MRLGLAFLAVVLLAPLAQAADFPAPANVRVQPGNQALIVRWDAVAAAGVTGYFVHVYADGALVQTLDATGTEATFRGVNDRPYAVTVAAHDATGSPGAASTPVAAVAELAEDQTYLALGLIVIWFGIWMYAFLLTRTERDLRNRVDRLRSERERRGERR